MNLAAVVRDTMAGPPSAPPPPPPPPHLSRRSLLHKSCCLQYDEA